MNPRLRAFALSLFLATAAALLSAEPATPTAAAVPPAKPAGVRAFTIDSSLGAYSPERGYGYDLGTQPSPEAQPYFFSVAVPEGNYRVTVVLGDDKAPSATTIKAESRRLMLENVTTRAGESVTRSFIVNVRNPSLPPPEVNAPGGSSVLLNPREKGIRSWDEKLTLEINGTAPAVRSVEIEPVTLPTVFLAGDSTVTDQPSEPGASWGQMLPRFFKPVVAIANHAESGETMKSFIAELRLAKILSQAKTGDWLFIQFAHNDEKKNWPQTYVEAHTTYKAYLRVFIAEARLRGMNPVLVTSMQRRNFDKAGKIKNTHGYYPEAMREVAREENVPLIDLEKASIAFYEALGPVNAPLAFSAGGKDATHHDNYGAYELAKCVAQAIREAKLPLAADLADDFTGFDPAQPDLPDAFTLAPSPGYSRVAPRGN